MGPLGEASVLGLECITRLMECIFAEHAIGHHDPEAQKLKANDDFVYYITTVVHISLSKVHCCCPPFITVDLARCIPLLIEVLFMILDASLDRGAEE